MNTPITQNRANSSLQRVRWTTSDLEGFPGNGDRYEIIDGDLFVTRAPHWDHQNWALEVCMALQLWSKQTGLGQASFTPGIIYTDVDNVIPDVVWVSAERLPLLLDEAGHLTGSPELVVEVLSKSEKDRKRDRETKLKLYSVQGVLEYWIIDGEPRQIEVYRRQQAMLAKTLTLYSTDTLTSPLLPGFELPLRELFGVR
ncbi:MAG: Uma2 family endonuclease [Leptolyngbyaceae bacterium]|nr:Uma2 family endonuclease [Leptolyngbyaceae bacterium]